MAVYLGYFIQVGSEDVINNSYNARLDSFSDRIFRGNILAEDGTVLAQTQIDEDGNESRVYTYGSVFDHVVGYSARGKTGIEAMANFYLLTSHVNLIEQIANELAGKKNPGDSVYTTLDAELQQAAYAALGDRKGAVIAMEPDTGKILAMVSHPDFDPNSIGEIWEDLVDNDSSTVLVNRATQGLYPPGSTFKIVTALEYIRENPNTYQNYSYTCNGAFRLGNSKISCYHGSSHGTVDFTRSFAKSCNSSFANIGMSLDRTAFQETLNDLLFNKELPLTLNYARSSALVSDDTPPAEMMQTSIGQGKTQITPMHLNMITCAIANNGVLMKPYAIDHVENDEGTVIKSFKPSEYGSLMSEEESAILRQLMTDVVQEGTASKLKGLEYTAAGKTGSAEYNNIKGDSHAWFTGFAPAEDPEVCVTIIVEGAGSGGDYAVPIARRIFDAYFSEKQ